MPLLLAGVIVFAALAVSASAGAPKVTASVTKASATERVVRIVNHDRVTYSKFVVQTATKPALIRTTCGVVQRDGGFNGTTFNWKYTATCKKALPPGRAFDIRLTTTPQGGSVFVYVVVNKVPIRIR